MESGRAANWTALVWLPAAVVLSLPAYLWHQDYFRSTGSYFLLVRALPILCVVAFLYARWLRPLVRRYELPLLLLFPVVLSCAVHPWAVVSVAVIGSAALVLGDLLTPLLRFEEEDAPIAWTCGFGMLILISAALGKLSAFRLSLLLVVFALCLIRLLFVWRRLRTWLVLPFARWNASKDLASTAVGICMFFLFLFTACSLLMALTPVTAFDVLSYHFPLARHYAQSHSIQPVPGIFESYYPQGAEALMALGFLLGGEPAASLLMPLLGVVFLWLLVRVGRMCGLSASAAVTGAAIAATFPFLQWTFSVPKNDAAFSLFQLGALYSFLKWQEGRGWRWLVLLAFLLGQTAGIKHVAIIGLAAMAPLCLFAWWREKWSLRVALAAPVVFAVTGLFWHVQTWMVWGDPTFPSHLFQAVHTPSQEHGAALAHAVTRYLTLPWYLLFQGQKAFESITPNPLGMFCFLLLPPAIVKLRNVRWTGARKACLCFVGVYLLYWCSILSTLRYAIVPFSLIGLVLGASLCGLIEAVRGWRRTSLLAVLSYGFLFSLLVFLSIAVNTSQAAVLLNRITPQEFLMQVVPATRPLFRVATIAPGVATFGVNACARYYAPDPLHFSCALCDDRCQPSDVLPALQTGNFAYAILPSRPLFRQLDKDVVSSTGATVVEDDGQFAILRLKSPR